jgi:hypothetical protein
VSFRKLGLIRGLAVNAGNVLSLRVDYPPYTTLDKCFVASGLYHILRGLQVEPAPVFTGARI